MKLLKWNNKFDGDFFATMEDNQDIEARIKEAYATGEIDNNDIVQVFDSEPSGEYYPEPIAEYSLDDFSRP